MAAWSALVSSVTPSPAAPKSVTLAKSYSLDAYVRASEVSPATLAKSPALYNGTSAVTCLRKAGNDGPALAGPENTVLAGCVMIEDVSCDPIHASCEAGSEKFVGATSFLAAAIL